MKKKYETKPIAISDIKVSSRFREDYGDIVDFAKKILASDTFHTDIILDGDLNLLAGGRRLKALQLISSGDEMVWGKPVDAIATKAWDKVPCKIYFDLDEIDKLKFEFLENFGRKDFTWPETARMVEAIHDLCTQKYGSATKGRTKKGWSVEDTGKEIGMSKSEVSKYLTLAEGIKNNPELTKISARSVASSRMKKISMDKLVRSLKRGGSDVLKDVQLIVGDSEEELLSLPDNSVDLIITDPPWGIDFEDNVSEARTSRYMVTYDNGFDIVKTLNILSLAYKKLRESGAIYMFYSAFPEKVIEAQNLLKGAGFQVEKIPLVWYKQHVLGIAQEKRHILSYELIHYGWKGEKPFLEVPSRNVIEAQVAFSDRIHSAEKPIDLLKTLLEISSQEGHIVLDPYGGSCILGDACIELGRKAIIIEKEESLINLAKFRIAKGG